MNTKEMSHNKVFNKLYNALSLITNGMDIIKIHIRFCSEIIMTNKGRIHN